MKKFVKIILIVIITIITLCVFHGWVIFHKQEVEAKRIMLRWRISEAIESNQNGEIPFVDLSQLTNFTWDRVYFFGPYADPERIDSVLGFVWIGSRFIQMPVDEGHALIVFTRNRHVVQYVVYSRGDGDFAYLDNNTGFSIEEAQFTVDEKRRMLWVGENP